MPDPWYNRCMITVPDDLESLEPASLYAWKDVIREYRSQFGRRQTPEAAQVRTWAKAEIARLNRELRRRKLPLRAPDDDRRYGPQGR
jgi:hypothetical protein